MARFKAIDLPYEMFTLSDNQELEYIPLVNDTPAIAFKNTGGLPLADVLEYDSFNLLVPPGIVVLDFDDEPSISLMWDLAQETGLQCRILKSVKGHHYYFKTPSGKWKNWTKRQLLNGLVCDWRVGSRNGMVRIKRDGKYYKVLQDIPVFDTCELPKWLESMPEDAPKFAGLKDGQGRNSGLSAHIMRMACLGATKEEIIFTLKFINEKVFGEPLDDYELAGIMRDDNFPSMEDIAIKNFFSEDGKRFMHDKLADHLIEEYFIVTKSGVPYMYDGSIGYYKPNKKHIENLTIDVYPGCLARNRREVVDYVETRTTRAEEDFDPKGDERYIVNVPNGRLNLRTGQLTAHSPLALDFQQIPVRWDPDAKSAFLNERLKVVFDGDQELIDLYEEIVGYTLMRSSEFAKFFIFLGDGSNGKSAFQDMIAALIGRHNYVGMSIQQLEDRFMPADLTDMLACIGDDIGSSPIRDTGNLKKIVTGNALQVERKGRDPFVMHPYATLIYGANKVPHIADNSSGMLRRMIIVPFNVVFGPGTKGFDPHIGDKLQETEVLEALLARGVKGAQRLLANKHFTDAKASRDALDEFSADNSTVKAWFKDRRVNEEWLSDKSAVIVYENYRLYCDEMGLRNPLSRRVFGVRTKSENGMFSVVKWIEGRSQRAYSLKNPRKSD